MYQVELIKKEELEKQTIPSVEKKIARLELDLLRFNRIIPELQTEEEKDKLASKTKKVALLKSLLVEADRVIKENDFRDKLEVTPHGD